MAQCRKCRTRLYSLIQKMLRDKPKTDHEFGMTCPNCGAPVTVRVTWELRVYLPLKKEQT